MQINIRGGTTTDHSVSLCASCKHGQTLEFANGGTCAHCHWLSVNLPSPVVKCSHYLHKNTLTAHEMKEQAWVITPGREQLGFRQIKKLSQEEREKIEEPIPYE